MRSATIAAGAALSLALGFAVTPVAAGQHGSTSHVHIHGNVSSKNLRLLQRQLHGTQRQAVKEELSRRDQRSLERRDRELGAGWAGNLLGHESGARLLFDLGLAGTHFGGHSHGH